MNFQRIATRVFLSFIIVTLVFTGSFSYTTSANGNVKETTIEDNEITNFEYITQTDEKLEYTFTEKGTDYKVIEYLSERKVVSHVYRKKLGTNEFKKYDIVTTTYMEDENTIKQNSTYTGETHQVDISPILEDQEQEKNLSTTNNVQPAMGTDGFVYQGTTYGTNTPTKWLVGAIAISLAAITKLPASAKWIINLSNLTFQLGKDKLYYSYSTYRKGTGIGSMVTRTVRTVYLDSKRTNALASTVYDASRTGSKLVAKHVYK